MHPLLFCCLIGGAQVPPIFLIETASEERASGSVVRLGREFAAVIATPRGEVMLEHVLRIRRNDRAIPPSPTGPHVVTTTGDRIAGTVLGGDVNSIRVLPGAYALKPDQAWRIPITSTVVAWLVETPANTPLDARRYDWLAAVKNQDAVRFVNGDTAFGVIERLDTVDLSPRVALRAGSGESRLIAARDLTAIALNPALARARKPKAAYVHVILVDGTRIDLEQPAIANGILSGEPIFGGKVAIPLTVILAVDVYRGRATYLSDLTPKKVDQSSFLGIPWSLGMDRTVAGAELRYGTTHGESTADRGLGMQPSTKLTYDLGKSYQRFEALVGLVPNPSTVRAHAVVRIRVDETLVSNDLLVQSSPGKSVPVQIDVRGAIKLELEVDYGPAGSARSDVVWADARLILEPRIK
jgi:hypothetical protein